MTSFFKTDKVNIDIPGAADLGHRRSWLLSMDDSFNVIPMHPDADRYPDATANYGAAFSLAIPTAFVLACFARRDTRYHLDGNNIGSMSELHNAWGRDGTASHNVEQFTLDWWVDKASDSYGFRVEGFLTPRPETFCTWPPLRRLHSFLVSATLPLNEASRLFRDEEIAREKIELALQLSN